MSEPTATDARHLTPALTIVALSAVAVMTACGTHSGSADAGPMTTEQHSVAGVHAVDLRTSGDLTISTGSTPSLTITAPASTLRDLTASVHSGTVILDSRPGHNTSGDIHYALTLPQMDALAVAGSGSAHGTIVASRALDVTVSGSGSAAVAGLSATAVSVHLSGSGDISLTGTTISQRVDLGGSGDYDGTQLTSRNSEVSVDGSGDAQVVASESLHARIGGSGDITYAGTPAVTQHISGNGTLSER